MIVFIISSILLLALCIYLVFNKVEKDELTEEYNTRVQEQKEKLIAEIQRAEATQAELVDEITKLQARIEAKTEEAENLEENFKLMVEASLSTQKEMSRMAFENYCEVLENKYKEEEEEYERSIDALNVAYSSQQLKLLSEAKEMQEEVYRIKATRDAAREAARREKEIQEKQSFYCLKVSDVDLQDIAKLQEIKKTLHSPRILSMLIWSTYIQKPLKALAANVLGTTNPVTGIYKITNTITGECYIGQARDIAKRWAEHAKCGLDIDTPQGNKLYKSMKEYGVQNFSYELLEKCAVSDLDKKERSFIELYDSCNYGFNSTVGNK